MELLTISHAGDPALDMALTAAMLEAVAGGDRVERARVYRPGPTVAFGRMDRLSRGFPAACEAARVRGLTPLVRLGGGRAAVYGPECVVIELIRPAGRISEGLEERFVELAELITAVLVRSGVASEIGELPGEYCPGRFSVHLRAGPKVAGLAQRVVSGAALTTAVVVVDGGPVLREAIGAIYAALELDVDPSTAGAITDQHPGVRTASIVTGAIELLAERCELTAGGPEPRLLARARELVALP
jgi:octanoyl-[GcvH]:protein N-octanoyltransferase